MVYKSVFKSVYSPSNFSVSSYQSGGGVAPPSFTPADLTGLQLWLDASDSSTVLNSISPDTPATDGQTVRRWLDKSGNGLHAEQATAANQPLLDADGQNSKGVLTFDGVNDYLTLGTTSSFNFLHDGTASLIVIVAKAGTSANPDALYAYIGNNNATGSATGVSILYDDRALFGFNNDYTASISRSVPSFFTATVRQTNKITVNAFNVIESDFDADNATASLRLLATVNGGAQFGGNTFTNTPSVANATYAMRVGDAGNGVALLNGGIAELIICNDPNTALRSDLRNYLASKWGITLP